MRRISRKGNLVATKVPIWLNGRTDRPGGLVPEDNDAARTPAMIDAAAPASSPPSSAPPSATPEEPSVEFHKPKPVHNWREFLAEIGVVVIGVCIALAAEQTVEWLHWRTQVAE